MDMSEKEFELLFKNQFTAMCNIANTVVKDENTAKDIVQQVFIKLWNSKEKLTIKGSTKAYLYRMVINTSLNHIEKEKKYTRLEQSYLKDEEYKTDEQSFKDEREKKVRYAIAELPKKCQTVFLLSRFENLTNKEIANHLGISVKTVEKHITVAFKALRKKLKPILDSGLDIIILFFIIVFNN